MRLDEFDSAERGLIEDIYSWPKGIAFDRWRLDEEDQKELSELLDDTIKIALSIQQKIRKVKIK